jgi:surface antigen
MSGPVADRAFRPQPYRASAVASLRLAAALSLALSAGGCAVTGSMGSLFGGKSPEGEQAYASGEVTGSVTPVRLAATSLDAPSETDLVFARMAIVEVLRRGKDVSAPWENPSSGARGTVTPIASAYVRDGATCHDFLASYLHKGAERWLQGEACRERKGDWQVKSLRPWARS